MKKKNTISKHDILRTISIQEGKLNYLLDALNGLNYNINSYIEMKKDYKKYKKYLEKQIEKQSKS